MRAHKKALKIPTVASLPNYCAVPVSSLPNAFVSCTSI